MYTIQIVGAGYTGARIARFFKEKKQKVFALTRSKEKAAQFEAEGINTIVADLNQPDTLKNIPFAHFIIICPAPDEGTEEQYEKIYLQGIGNYLNAIKKNPQPHLIVYLSSTGVWQDQTGEIFDENILPEPKSRKAQILVEAERQVLNCGLLAAVLRLAGIYGPARNRLEAFLAGKWPASGEERWMNLIHADDIAAMLPVFFKNAAEGEVYLGVDDEPVLASHLYGWLCGQTGKQPKIEFSAERQRRRYINTKLKSLGIVLKYPSYREGYSEFLKKE